jgi:hypothetical protein
MTSSSFSSDSFDKAGNVTQSTSWTNGVSDNKTWEFDAAGHSSRWTEAGPWGTANQEGGEIVFDGDGRPAKESDLSYTLGTGWTATPKYNLYSSVTGEKITELNETGAFFRNYVYMGHTEIAFQDPSGLMWKLTDPISGSTRQTSQDGSFPSGDEEETRIELAGLKTYVPHNVPQSMPPPAYVKGSSSADPENGCVDSLERPAPCFELKFAPAPTPLPYTDPSTPVPDNVASVAPGRSGFAFAAGPSSPSYFGDGDEPDEPIRIHTVEFKSDWEEGQSPAEGGPLTWMQEDISAAIKTATANCLAVIAKWLPEKPATVETIRNNNRSQQPLNLLLAQAAVESTFGERLDGFSGELGLFQTGPATVKDNQKRLNLEKYTTEPKGGTLRNDFALNTRIATTLLQDRIDKTGSVINGLEAYKAGLGGAPPLGQPTFRSIVYANSIVNCSHRILYPRQ